MDLRLSSFVVANPPWVKWREPDHEVQRVSANVQTYMGVRYSFADAVRTKLASIDTSESVELRRFTMIAAHELSHLKIKWPGPAEFEAKPLLFDAYGVPTSFQTFSQGTLCSYLTVEEVEFLQSQQAFHFHDLLLLNFVFTLIDRVVDYWNEVARARRTFRTFSGVLRQLLATALQFKPFHTPLRLFPSSIHPISSAA